MNAPPAAPPASHVRILLIAAPLIRNSRLLPYVPYGLLSLQAAAKGLGAGVDILPFSHLHRGEVFRDADEFARGIVESLDDDGYDAVGLSTTCGSFHYSLGVACGVKRRWPKIQVWMGGPQASVAPPLVLERFPEVDAVFSGEGEASFRDLLRRRGEPLEKVPAGLSGVHTRHSRFLPRAPIPDLDELPFIDEADDLLSSLAASEQLISGAVPLEAERGCPGRCTFCSTRLHWGGRGRYKSARRIIAEMDRLHAVTGKRHFSLLGDDLAASPRGLLALCEDLRRELRPYRWICSLRLDRLEARDLGLLWDAGCRGMFVGVESGSQDTLNRARKGIDLRRLVPLLREAVERGFSLETSFMVGFPWETSSDMRKTYALHVELLKIGVYHSHVVAVCPLPGTDLERSYAESVRPDGRNTRIVSDRLPYGPRTTALVKRCPELCRRPGCFRSEDVDPMQVESIVQAASIASTWYERSRKQLVLD